MGRTLDFLFFPFFVFRRVTVRFFRSTRFPRHPGDLRLSHARCNGKSGDVGENGRSGGGNDSVRFAGKKSSGSPGGIFGARICRTGLTRPHSLTATVKTWERTASSWRTVFGATSFSLLSRYSATNFPWIEAMKRFDGRSVSRSGSSSIPGRLLIFDGITSRSSRSRTSESLVLSASFLETKIPRANPGSTVVAQV